MVTEILVCKCLLSFSCTGTIFPFFHRSGKTPVFKAVLNIIIRGMAIESPHILIILIDIPSQPCALFELRSLIILRINSRDKGTSLIRLSVLYVMLGRTLPLSIIEHCFAKYLLKIFDLVRKFVSKISFTRRGGIVGIFFFPRKDLRFTNIL